MTVNFWPKFGLIGQLAFYKPNIAGIVLHGTIEVIMDAVAAHPTYEMLMVKSIQTLDNVSMANEEYAQIIAQAEGESVIAAIMQAFPENDEVQAAGRSALVSMNAMRCLHTKVAVPEIPDELKPETDPLIEFRAMLKAGSQMTEYHKGTTFSRHIYVSQDWQYFVIKDSKSNQKKNGVMIPLRNMMECTAGLHDNHTRRIFGKPKADVSFNIICNTNTYSFETSLKKDQEKWVRAITALIDTYHHRRKWLLQK